MGTHTVQRVCSLKPLYESPDPFEPFGWATSISASSGSRRHSMGGTSMRGRSAMTAELVAAKDADGVYAPYAFSPAGSQS
ncbi:MAG: hypothetical protein R2705_24535 [Ilumatobacteraceae bacterium]